MDHNGGGRSFFKRTRYVSSSIHIDFQLPRQIFFMPGELEFNMDGRGDSGTR